MRHCAAGRRRRTRTNGEIKTYKGMRMRRSHSFKPQVGAIVLLALLAGLLQGTGAHAQGSKVGAGLDGMVRDSGGGAVAGAAVTVRNTATNQGRALVTEQDGSFHAAELSAGTYEVMVEHGGFAPYRHTGVELALDESVRLGIVLAPASSAT